jgi:tellurite resistance protein
MEILPEERVAMRARQISQFSNWRQWFRTTCGVPPLAGHGFRRLPAFAQLPTVAPPLAGSERERNWESHMTEPMNHHAALIYVMVTMSAVDRTMTDAELARIGEIVSNLPIFADFDPENLVKTAEACGEILSADGGLDHVLLLLRSNLPKKLRETAYAVALEIAAADLNIRPEETRFLEMLRDSLDLDRLTTAGIERGIRARNTVL